MFNDEDKKIYLNKKDDVNVYIRSYNTVFFYIANDFDKCNKFDIYLYMTIEGHFLPNRY